MSNRFKGFNAAFLSAIFLGLSPVLGRQAILLGVAPLEVVALRTVLATLLLFMVMALFNRKFLYIYPAGLLGCLLAGGINGIGSLLFYSSLARIDASIGQLLNSMYPVFLAFWMILDFQPPSKMTVLRIVLSIPAVYLLTQTHVQHEAPDLIGVAMMLGASALYALHLPINQRVLFDMPAPTVTLYTLLAMSAVVVPAYLFFGDPSAIGTVPPFAWWPVLGLTLVTFLSRLTLFTGIKHLGGMQTAIIGLGELVVTFAIAFLLLGERLSPQQWLGAGLLVVSILMIEQQPPTPPHLRGRGWLRWLSPPVPYELPPRTPSNT